MVTPGFIPVFMEVLVMVAIFLAIVLSVLGFVILIKYRRFGSEKIELLDHKISSINNVLDNCERMIDELNKLSDYIITNVEEKGIELKNLIDEADKRINIINNQSHFEARLEPEKPITIENVEAKPAKKTSERSKKSTTTKTESDDSKTESTKNKTTRKKKTTQEDDVVVTPKATTKAAAKAYKESTELINATKEEKPSKYIVDTVVIDDKDNEQDNGKMYAFLVNSKVKDVIELSKQGLDTTEISKRLKMGIGEIELILGIKK